MSVPLIAASSEAAGAGAPATPPSPTPGAGGQGDFATALAAASAATSPTTSPGAGQLRSVPLGEMVAAYAASPALGAPATAEPAGAAPPVSAAAPAEAAAGVGLAGGSGAGAQVLQAGERYLGVPYKWGGTDPDTGFDCSGFVQRAFADIGVQLPRVSVDQARQGTEVASMAQARPGDLVFWNGDGSRPNHIGIYAGEGRMLVAPSSGDVVRYQEITREPHSIRRIV